MEWHYTENGQQVGPITEERLNELSAQGVVKADTLVWRAGMAEWRPYRAVNPNVPPPPPGQADAAKRFCASCGRQFAAADLAMFGESAICAECKPAWIQRVRQGMTSTTPSNFEYGGFWIRAGAFIIDGIITGLLQSAIGFGLLGQTIFSSIQQAADQGDVIGRNAAAGVIIGAIGAFQLLSIAVQLAYFVFFWVKFGATPGKMAVGLKVVTPTGGPISVGRAIGRYFGMWLSSIILCIGFMMAGWDPEKRSLHDRLADTRVIRAR